MNIVFAGYPWSAHVQFNARTPTWLNQKRYTTLLKSMTNIIIIFVVHPRIGSRVHILKAASTLQIVEWHALFFTLIFIKKVYTTVFLQFCFCWILWLKISQRLKNYITTPKAKFYALLPWQRSFAVFSFSCKTCI